MIEITTLLLLLQQQQWLGFLESFQQLIITRLCQVIASIDYIDICCKNTTTTVRRDRTTIIVILAAYNHYHHHHRQLSYNLAGHYHTVRRVHVAVHISFTIFITTTIVMFRPSQHLKPMKCPLQRPHQRRAKQTPP